MAGTYLIDITYGNSQFLVVWYVGTLMVGGTTDGFGGRGGNLGQAGQYPVGYRDSAIIAPGGAAGKAVIGNGFITWQKSGTIYGAIT